MSRRRRGSFFGEWYQPPPKMPVPENGIAVGRFGATWWGREWIASLERLGRTWSNRLPRGRSYARQGRVVDLEVGAGTVSAGVVGTRKKPYRVEIQLPVFDGERWRRAVESLADDVSLLVKLLRRELPDEAGERLREAGADLFPSRGELGTSCSCPDIANPCKHVAAVHYLFAAALDNDPFLIFRLRGIDRDGLVAAIGGDPLREATAGAGDGKTLSVDGPSSDLERPEEIDVNTFLGLDLAAPVVEVEPRAPRVELVGIRRLGPAPRGLEGLPAAITPMIRGAGRLALELAWRETGGSRAAGTSAVARAGSVPPQAATGSPQPGRSSRQQARGGGRSVPAPADDLLRRVESALAEAAQPLSKRQLLAVVGAGDSEVTGALCTLRRARLVVTRGRGPATRYAALQRSANTGEQRRGDGATDAAGDLTSRVLKALASARHALPSRTLAERVGPTPERLRPVLVALRQNGVVEMIGQRRSARYRLSR